MAWFPRSWFGASWFNRWFGGTAVPAPLLVESEALPAWTVESEAGTSPLLLEERARWDEYSEAEAVYQAWRDDASVWDVVLESLQPKVDDNDSRVTVELTHG